jgi:hypothetical protein
MKHEIAKWEGERSNEGRWRHAYVCAADLRDRWFVGGSPNSDVSGYPCFARARRTKKEQIPNGAARRVQPGEKHLVDLCDLRESGVLADNTAAKRRLEVLCLTAAGTRIKNRCTTSLHTRHLYLNDARPVMWFRSKLASISPEAGQLPSS